LSGEVEQIDLDGRTVLVRQPNGGHLHRLEYDHLVIALGSATNDFGVSGVAEHALTMKTLGDAIELRSRVIALLEEAEFERVVGDRGDQLSLVVAGGGFAGVETIGALNDFIREALPYYPHLSESDLRLVLVHAGELILPELKPALGRYAATVLARRGIEVLTGQAVAGCDGRAVRLASGETIPARTLVWTAGTAAVPVLRQLAIADGRGRIPVEPSLAVPGRPGVWALGDAAVVPDPEGRPYPPTAQHAIRQAKTLAENLVRSVRGEALRPFVFRTLGQLAAIGRRRGVANILGVNFSGVVAWLLWRTIYLVFAKDLVQYHTHPDRSGSGPELADTPRRPVTEPGARTAMHARTPSRA